MIYDAVFITYLILIKTLALYFPVSPFYNKMQFPNQEW